MWSKIYLAVLTAAVLGMFFFTFYANSWLGSIGNPNDALAGYEYYARLGSIFLAVSFVILLITANIILWNTRRGWALWTSYAFFAIFVILRAFWLEKSRYAFQYPGSVFFTPAIIGAGLIITAGIIVFVNQLLSLRLHERMYPPPEAIENDEAIKNEE
jgi:hypothetical protein